MAAILDAQNGKRFGQVQFVNEVVDFITTAEGRQPCYDLLDGLHSDRQAALRLSPLSRSAMHAASRCT